MSGGDILISVIVAVRNGAGTLERCLQSVLEQRHARVDLVVIDGGSTDGSVDIIKRHAAQLGSWLSEPDRGVYDAWNKGLDRAKGSWICFLGADDYFWDRNVLARLAAALAAAPPAVRVVYGSMVAVTGAGTALAVSGDPWPRMKSRFADLPLLPHPGMMHRRSLFEQHGKFDTSFRIAGDYELLLRELKSGDAVFVPDLRVAGLQIGGLSSTRDGMRRSLLEVRRAQKLNGIPWPGRHWLAAYARMLVREALFFLLGDRLARRALDWGRMALGKERLWTRLP